MARRDGRGLFPLCLRDKSKQDDLNKLGHCVQHVMQVVDFGTCTELPQQGGEYIFNAFHIACGGFAAHAGAQRQSRGHISKKPPVQAADGLTQFGNSAFQVLGGMEHSVFKDVFPVRMLLEEPLTDQEELLDRFQRFCLIQLLHILFKLCGQRLEHVLYAKQEQVVFV